MSPRNPSEGIHWRLIGPALVLWLAAVVALSAFTAPTLARDARADPPAAAAAVAEQDAGEAPILTLALVAVALGAIAVRPARRAVVRRPVHDLRRPR